MSPFDTLADIVWAWLARDRPRTTLRVWLERLGLLAIILLVGLGIIYQFR